ncbi:phosphopantetheine-binding protein [Sandaracinus amylolyticus]|uniref:phosphopantetheine-binding protein n=1 Tax=Sandaracinus amylolyticus TaxID=927083 RepID=UPI0022A77603|nr:phosphopantetheine-binding protein [Sandaracinus amylolyticus]UJR78709.1 Isochorismatase [Sandaracinus amylolyticus]
MSALPTTYAALAAEIAALIEIDATSLAPDDSLLDWGLDSIRLMSLVERLREGGVEVTFADLAEEPTLRGLARHVGVEP